MPILTNVGQASWGQRTLRAIIYAALLTGAAGIIYPLLIVLGQTLSDNFDLRDNAIVPYYLTDRNELLVKYLFNHEPRSPSLLASRHQRNDWSSQAGMRGDSAYYREQEEELLKQGLALDAWPAVTADFDAFKASLPVDDLLVRMFRIEDYYRPYLQNKYGAAADELRRRLEGGEEQPAWLAGLLPDPGERAAAVRDRGRLGVLIMNHELPSDYRDYYAVELLPARNYLVPFWRAGHEPKDELWREFKKSLPAGQLLLIPDEAYWHAYLKSHYRVIGQLNSAWGETHQGFYELALPDKTPANPAVRQDWETFLTKRWPRRLLTVGGDHNPAWQMFVRAKLKAKADTDEAALALAGKLSGQSLQTWADLRLPATRPADETLDLYWCEFTSSGQVPAADLRPTRVTDQFRQFLRTKYAAGGDEAQALAALNSAWRTKFADWASVPLPATYVDFCKAKFEPGRLRLEFATESFTRVVHYLFGSGQAVWNTIVLVGLSLLSALSINPLAAYSLSRFPMRSTHKILLFFLATMAFPAEVAMVPNFLLLRDLGLLNTYAALILPGMANGFSIFLLKGFFDSLPQELYQAAEIDGASEFQIFRLVAMPLVKPILAYIGLGAFVAAYSGFMWALVICPRQEMWTLMVWVYDFQTQNHGNNYVMAATVLVSLPPLVVFLFANRIIMKGIVIPAMK